MRDKAATIIPSPEIKKENLLAVMALIEANPACHRQDTWHCGTSHCFGGWAQIMGGNEANDATVRRDARIFLGITEHEADKLFAPNNSRPELRAMVDSMVDDGYSRAVFDRDGLDPLNNPAP